MYRISTNILFTRLQIKLQLINVMFILTYDWICFYNTYDIIKTENENKCDLCDC